ncbi:MAG TPA: hypothetical protein VGV89_02955 [Thermoplasmata archaeon]|nr:hypothetical protein [Thermoplasmata archaeon]
MGCTCRIPARCKVCNLQVTVPLSNMDSASGASAMLERLARRDSAETRAGLQRLIEGSIRCPSCGNTVYHTHSRSCVAAFLGAVGIGPSDRASLLAKITFPEG